MNLLQLQKRRDDAMSAVANATSEKARTKALSDLETASLALATLMTRTDSKSVKTVKKEERYEEVDEEEDEDESEDEESDEEADDEPKKPASDEDADDEDDSDDDDDDDDDDSDDDSDEDEADEDDEEEEAEDEDAEEDERAAAAAVGSAKRLLARAKKAGKPQAIATARVHLRAVKRAVTPKASAKFAKLKAACTRITGRKGLAAIIGSLDGLKATASSTEKLAADVARIKAKSRREKVDELLASARRAGKVTRAEVSSLRSQGIKDPKWLRAYLSAVAPKRVRTLEDGALDGKALDGGDDSDARRANALDAQGMSNEQRKAVEQMAMSAGMGFDEFVAAMNKTKANGAGRRS